MSLLIEILVTLLVLSVLVIGHEFGHYAAGRLLHFDILEFAVGMGPKLFGFRKKGIEYNVRAFPIGGMCRFAGEDETPDTEGSFRAKTPWKRAAVVFAGPFMNFVMAFILCLILFWGFGTYDSSRVILASVDASGPAGMAGMLPDDEIVSVDGKNVKSFDSLRDILNASDGERIPVEALRNGELIGFVLKDAYSEKDDAVMMGVTITNPRVRASLSEGVRYSAEYCLEMGKVIFVSLKMLFTGEAGINDMSGVVGVTRIVGEAVSLGWASVLSLSVMLSVNLGIMNLLPVPALDGGRLMFVIVEWVRGKPIPAEKEGVVHFVGMVLLLALMVYLVFHDVIVWVGG